MVVANHLLITGPSRGGKSEWAEQRIRELAGAAGITYLATGPTLPDDAAWQRRLSRHRHRRPDHWRLLEASSLSAVSQLLMEAAIAMTTSFCWTHWVVLWPQNWSSLRSAGWSCRPPLSWLLPREPPPWCLWLRRWAGVLFRQPPSEAVFETAMAASPGCVSSTVQKAGW